MKKTKKAIALLLSVVMVLGLLPTVALADGNETEIVGEFVPLGNEPAAGGYGDEYVAASDTLTRRVAPGTMIELAPEITFGDIAGDPVYAWSEYVAGRDSEWVLLNWETGDTYTFWPQESIDILFEVQAEDAEGNVHFDQLAYSIIVEPYLDVESDDSSRPFVDQAGDDAYLKVVVTDAEAAGITYQWYVDGEPAAGATGDEFTLANVTTYHDCRCDVSAENRTTTEIYFNVGVENHLAVETVGSQFVSAALGGDASMQARVSADDMTGVTVEWLFGSNPPAAGTLENGVTGFTLENVQNSTSIVCRATDRYGNSNEAWFSVSIATGLTVETGPKHVLVPYGGSATLTAAVTISDGFSYYVVWNQEPAENNELTYTVEDVTERTEVQLWVYDEYGNDVYEEYYVDVDNGLTVEPDGMDTDLVVTAGARTQLRVVAAADEGDVSCSWYREVEEEWHGGTRLEPADGGADTTVYTVGPIYDTQVFVCVATDMYGGQAEVRFTVGVSEGPGIRWQPTNWYGAIGDTAHFSLDTYDEGLTYQWEASADGGETWTAVDPAGVTSQDDWSMFETPITQAALGDLYRCVVSDGEGSTASREVHISTEQDPVLRLRRAVYVDDGAGNWEPETDEFGNTVYDDSFEATSLTLQPGQMWGATELWYGETRLTELDLLEQDLIGYNCGPSDNEAVEYYFGDGEYFVVHAHDWLTWPEDGSVHNGNEQVYASITYANTNLYTGTDIKVYTELPPVGAYSAATASKATYLGSRTGYWLSLTGDDTFYVISEDGLTITDLSFEEGGEYLPAQRVDEQTWSVSVQAPAFDDWAWISGIATVSDGNDTREESFTFIAEDHRPALVWRWADDEWIEEESYEQGGYHSYTSHDWEWPQTRLDVFPGQYVCGSFLLRTWNDERSEFDMEDMPLDFLTFDDGGNGFYESLDPDEGYYFNIRVGAFGEAAVTYDYEGTTLSLPIISYLPDIGWYDDGIFENGALVELDENSEQRWLDAFQAEWAYDGTNDTIYLVALGDIVLNGYSLDDRIDATATLDDDGRYVAVTVNTLRNERDHLDVYLSGVRGDWDNFDNEGHGIEIYNAAPGLRIINMDEAWDDQAGRHVYTRRDEEPQSWVYASPGDWIVSIWGEAGDVPTETLTADDIVSSDDSVVTVEDVSVEDGAVRLLFHDFGSAVLRYTDATTGTVYSMGVDVQLPDIGWYSAVPATEQDYYDYFLREWNYDGTSDTIYLVVSNDEWHTDTVLEEVLNGCGSDLTITLDQSGKYAAVTVNMLNDDWLNVDISGRWNEHDTFDHHGRGLHVNDVTPGLFFRWAGFEWDEQTQENIPTVEAGQRLEHSLDGWPEARHTVQFVFRDAQGAETVVETDDLIVSQDAPFELIDRGDGFTEVYFTAFGSGTVTYGGSLLIVRSELPGLGWFSSYEDVSTETYLTRWDYTDENDTVYFVVRDPARRLQEIHRDEGTAATVTLSEDQRYAVITVSDLTDGWLRLVFTLERYDEERGEWVTDETNDWGIGIDDRRGAIDTGLWAEADGDDIVWVDFGEDAELTVTAHADTPEGEQSNPLTYTWYKLAVPEVDGGEAEPALIEGAAGATLTLADVTRGGEYGCFVHDNFGNSAFVWFRVNVNDGLEIHAVSPLPADDIHAAAGESVTLTALATVDAGHTFRYQWYKVYQSIDDERLEGQNGATLTVDRGGTYECMAVDELDNIVSVQFFVDINNGFDMTNIACTDNPIFLYAGDDAVMTIDSIGDLTLTDRVQVTWYDEDWNVIEDAEGMSYTLENVTEDHTFYVVIDDGYSAFWVQIEFDVKVVPEGSVYEVSTAAELEAAVDQDTPVRVIRIVDDMTVTSDCTIKFDREHIENYHNTYFQIMPGVTVTVQNGGRLGGAWYTFEGGWDDELTPDATIYNSGTVVVYAEDGITGELTANEGEIVVKAGGSAVVPTDNYGTITVEAGGALRTTQGDDCTNYGEIDVAAGGALEARFGTTIRNDGTLELEGTFTVNCARYDDQDHMWFDNHGAVNGGGDIILRNADPNNMQVADFDALIVRLMAELGQQTRFENWDDVNIYRELDAMTEAELAAAFPHNRVVAGEEVEGDMDTIVRLEDDGNGVDITVTGEIATMGRIVVPERSTLTVANGAYLEAAVENDGVIIVEEGGTLGATMGGAITDRGTIMVEAGGTLVSQMGGEVILAGAGSVLELDGTFRCGSVRYDDQDHVWFVNNGGMVLGSGEIVLYEAEPDTMAVADIDALIAQVEAAVTGSNVTVRAEAPAAVPTIEAQPADVQIPQPNVTVQFTVVATGDGLTYQWEYKDGDGAWTTWADKTKSVLSFNAIASRNGRQVRCVVTDSHGASVISEAATLTIGPAVAAPVITGQPADVQIPQPNVTVQFTVVATGEGLTYQWEYKDAGGAWTTWTDKTKSLLSFNAIASRNGRQVRCVVTNEGGTVTSEAATLTIAPAAAGPVITGQPADVRIPQPNVTVEFTVTATGEGLTYQWEYKDAGGAWTTWADKTKSALSFNAIATRNERQVRCIVTDGSGNTVTSQAATLYIEGALAITAQPTDAHTGVNETVAFEVAAIGTALSYQWQYRDPGGAWTNWADKTKSAMTCVAIAARSGRQVRCVVTDGSGNTVTSKAATILIEGPLAIIAQPRDASVAVNETAAFTVVATGTELTYQWQYKDPGGAWTDWADKTKSAMTCVAITARNGRQVRCVVTDGSGSTVTSNAASVLIEGALMLIVQPADVSTAANQTVAFEVVASGTSLTYQWQYRDPGGAWTNWADKTKSVMTCVAVAARNGRQVRCVIADGNGNTVTSAAATLTIA